jgi:hypothetical protein
MFIRKDWLEDEIELPGGKGKIEIVIHTRNVVFVHGEVLGCRVSDYQVDKPYGAAKWGPGWLTRLDMGVTDEERPNAQVTEIIVAAINKWAEKSAYCMDLAGQDDFHKDVKGFIGFVERFEEELEEAVEDNIKLLLDKYGDWITKLDDAKTAKHLERLLTMIGQVRQHLENVIEPDMRSLGKAILKRFQPEADLYVGPNYRPPHRRNELKPQAKAKRITKAAKPKRAKKKAAPAVTANSAQHVNGLHHNGNGLAAEEAVA